MYDHNRRITFNILTKTPYLVLLRIVKSSTFCDGLGVWFIMGERGSGYRIMVEEPSRKCPLGRLGRGWEDNIKMNFRELGCESG
jgi:hypothetical protein